MTRGLSYRFNHRRQRCRLIVRARLIRWVGVVLRRGYRADLGRLRRMRSTHLSSRKWTRKGSTEAGVPEVTANDLVKRKSINTWLSRCTENKIGEREREATASQSQGSQIVTTKNNTCDISSRHESLVAGSAVISIRRIVVGVAGELLSRHPRLTSFPSEWNTVLRFLVNRPCIALGLLSTERIFLLCIVLFCPFCCFSAASCFLFFCLFC